MMKRLHLCLEHECVLAPILRRGQVIIIILAVITGRLVNDSLWWSRELWGPGHTSAARGHPPRPRHRSASTLTSTSSSSRTLRPHSFHQGFIMLYLLYRRVLSQWFDFELLIFKTYPTLNLR